MGTDLILHQASLNILAKEIKESHELCLEGINVGLAHAVRVGHLLSEAKSHMKHGEFIPWIKQNCEFSRRAASTYMRVAKHCVEDMRLGNGKPASHLSYTRVVKMLSEKNGPAWSEPRPEFTVEVAVERMDRILKSVMKERPRSEWPEFFDAMRASIDRAEGA